MSFREGDEERRQHRREFLKKVIRTGSIACFTFVNLPGVARADEGLCSVPIHDPCQPDINCGKPYTSETFREDYNCDASPPPEQPYTWRDLDCGLKSRQGGGAVWHDGSCFRDSGEGARYDDLDCGGSNEWGFIFHDEACGKVLYAGSSINGDHDCDGQQGIGIPNNNDDDCGKTTGGQEFADESCGENGSDLDSISDGDNCGLMGPDYQYYVDL